MKQKTQRPLSKTQGGNWWVIRRANGSIMLNILERTKRFAIEKFGQLHGYTIVNWDNFEKKGYTCERVQICSTRKSPGRGDRRVVIVPSTFINRDNVEVLL